MPTPKKNESENAFVQRCISFVVKNEGKKPDQAYAICKGLWDKSQKDVNSDSVPYVKKNSTLEYLNERKAAGDSRFKRSRRRKPPRMLHPVSIERSYQSLLLSMVNEWQKITSETLEGLIPLLAKEARQDQWSEGAERLIAQLRLKIEEKPFPINTVSQQIGERTAEWNDKQWRKVMKATLGVDILQSQPWLKDQLNNFVSQNVTLIKDLQSQTLDRIEGTVQRGFAQGLRHEEIMKQIVGRDKSVFSKAKSRARLIARDQVSKLNGNLTRLKQKEIGVTHYIWRTSEDDRVRPTHRANNGKIFSWDDPPIETGHPGQDYQCRCWAEAYFGEEFATEEQIKAFKAAA